MEGKFNGLLKIEILGPRLWRLTNRLTFNSFSLTPGEIAILKSVGVQISASGNITAASGFETDLASVSRIFWIFLAPQDIARAAVIHDALYRSIKQYKFNTGRVDINLTTSAKIISDKVFKCALSSSEPAVPEWKQWVGYWFTVVFGWFALRATDYNLHTIGLSK